MTADNIDDTICVKGWPKNARPPKVVVDQTNGERMDAYVTAYRQSFG